MKILFLIKENSSYGFKSPKSGLLESARLTSAQLVKNFNVDSKVVVCIDGNSIDKEVHNFKPDICIIEAIWVTPAKLAEVASLHRRVIFTIRVHSEISFLSMEGIAIEWIKGYEKIKNVIISFNSFTTAKDFHNIGIPSVYLPNIYSGIRYNPCPILHRFLNSRKHKDIINIGCFGSIRPLKNQLVQAFAAIEFGNKNNKRIHFHINSSRVEQKGESALKNIRALFKGTEHKLIEHYWLPREEFLSIVSKMDIGLQVSLSESFNLVTADFVSCNVPIIVSETINWMPEMLQVENDVSSIVSKISQVLKYPKYYSALAKNNLNRYNSIALGLWHEYLLI